MSLPITIFVFIITILLGFYFFKFFGIHKVIKKHRRTDAFSGMLCAFVGLTVVLTYDELSWMKSSLTMFLLLILVPVFIPRKTPRMRAEGTFFRIHFCSITYSLLVICMPMLKPSAMPPSIHSWLAPIIIVGLLLLLSKEIKKMKRHARWLSKMKKERLQTQNQHKK